MTRGKMISLTKRRCTYLSVGLIILIPVCAYIWFEQQGWTEGKVEQAIKGSLLINSTRNQVERWLNKMNWTDYDYYTDVTGASIGHKTLPQLAGLDHRALSGMIKVNVPNPRVSLIWTGLIYVYFFFDHDGKLVNYYIYPIVFSF
jgi:hypothetical protein